MPAISKKTCNMEIERSSAIISATKRMLIIGILLTSLYNFVNPDLTVTPKDTEALIGGSTFFNCSTSISSAEIHWFHYVVGSNKERSFVYGYNQFYSPYQGRYHLEKDDAKAAYNLIISFVKPEDAGKYECQDDFGRGSKGSVELVVLEANPVCQSNMKPEGIIGPNSCGLEPEELHLSCLVPYRGNQPPIIIWKKAGSESPISEGTVQNISDNQATYYLKMDVNSDMHGSSYQCQTTRSATSQYGCTSESVNVIGSESSTVAIYWIVLVIVLIISIAISLTSGWCLHVLRVKRKAAKRQEECSRQEERPLVIDRNTAKVVDTDNKRIEELITENERLTAKINELEQRLYPTDKTNYTNAPMLVHAIVPKEAEKEKTPITGITILDHQLFVVKEKTGNVEVYDSQTFIAEHPLVIDNLTDPQDIASSPANHCLYIADSVNTDSNCEIIKLNPTEKVTKSWLTEGHLVRLSTYESSLIVCISDKRLVIEYSTEGVSLNTIRLSPGAKFEKLWHAIKLTQTNFAISHSKFGEDRNRVCIVDSKGDVLMAFEELPIYMFRINVPICLAEDRDKSILVADSTNGRLLLLSSTLQFERVLISDIWSSIINRHGLKGHPVRICLDEANGRIFVAENNFSITNKSTCKYGRISIFSITQKGKS